MGKAGTLERHVVVSLCCGEPYTRTTLWHHSVEPQIVCNSVIIITCHHGVATTILSSAPSLLHHSSQGTVPIYIIYMLTCIYIEVTYTL